MLKEKLMEDLKISMREKNNLRKNTIQMVRAAILQIEKDKGIQVEDDKILEIIAKEVKSKRDALKDFEKAEIGTAADGKSINEVVKELLA